MINGIGILGNMLPKTDEEIKEELGSRLCEYCPWENEGVRTTVYSNTCEHMYCDLAFEKYKESEECKYRFLSPAGRLHCLLDLKRSNISTAISEEHCEQCKMNNKNK